MASSTPLCSLSSLPPEGVVLSSAATYAPSPYTPSVPSFRACALIYLRREPSMPLLSLRVALSLRDALSLHPRLCLLETGGQHPVVDSSHLSAYVLVCHI
jgi:hypothetical protein